ncbi:MAG: hypothetical protein R3Y63_11845, partial [Eubacteriales bacterium]
VPPVVGEVPPVVGEVPPVVGEVPPVATSYQNVPPAQPVEKKKTNPVFVGTCIVLALGYAAWNTWTESPYLELKELVEETEYSQAVELYNDDIFDTTLWKTLSDKYLQAHLEVLLAEESFDYYEASSALRSLTYLEDTEFAGLFQEELDKVETAQRVKNSLSRGDELITYGDYLGAVFYYENLITGGETASEISTAYTEAKNAYRNSVLEEITDPTTEAELQNVKRLIDNALYYLPEDEILLEKMAELTASFETATKENAIQEINGYLEKENFQAALSSLSELTLLLPEDSEVMELAETTALSFENHTLDLVKQQSEKEEYELALKTLDDALLLLPDSSVFDTQYQEIVALIPVMLHELNVVESKGVFLIESNTVSDTVGNMYENGNVYIYGPGEASNNFYLGGAYDSLTFTLGVYGGDNDWQATVNFSIYTDTGEVLYEKKGMSRAFAPVTETIDVSGEDFLFIATYPSNSENSVRPMIANASLKSS